jgi:predicted PhzF superfamily epimerase YddE/YHI9
MISKHIIYQVDAFTKMPFRGNHPEAEIALCDHATLASSGILRISLKDNRADTGGRTVTIFKAELYA